MIYIGSDRRKKFYVGSKKVKKIYIGSERIYSAGNYVTYYVDSSESYTEEVESDATCLSPTTFTPTKSGYTFVGWRQDTTASSSVLSSLTMDDEEITLYAVFRETITLTYYNGSSTKSTTTGYQYYNNGNTKNPTFTLTAASVSGFTFAGWCTSSSATASVAYSSISSREFSSDTTVYAKYYQTITLTYYSTSSTASTTTGTRYFNSGNYSNPTFTISSPSVSGWTFLGWISGSTSATGTVSYTSISSTAFSANATLYAKFSQTITLSYSGNGSTSGSTSSQTGTRYWNAYGNYSNPSFTLKSNGFTRTNYVFLKWASGSTSGTQYSAGASVTLSASTTFYAIWSVVCRVYFQFYWRVYNTGNSDTSEDDGVVRVRIYNVATGSTLYSEDHGFGSTYGTSYTYTGKTHAGVLHVQFYSNKNARCTAQTDLYSNTSFSTVGLSSGSYTSDYGPDGSNNETTVTHQYYVSYDKLSL